MATSNTERQREYREKRSRDATRVSLWITNKASTNLTALATKQNTSPREGRRAPPGARRVSKPTSTPDPLVEQAVALRDQHAEHLARVEQLRRDVIVAAADRRPLPVLTRTSLNRDDKNVVTVVEVMQQATQSRTDFDAYLARNKIKPTLNRLQITRPDRITAERLDTVLDPSTPITLLEAELDIMLYYLGQNVGYHWSRGLTFRPTPDTDLAAFAGAYLYVGLLAGRIDALHAAHAPRNAYTPPVQIMVALVALSRMDTPAIDAARIARTPALALVDLSLAAEPVAA